MKTEIHRSNERGTAQYGWLTTSYSFSFAEWYNPSKMGFGALRVLNDDIIAPGAGFGKHGHRDMEIITIVTKGAVKHGDSMGNEYEVKAGDVQVMSAGTGVLHSEVNASDVEPLELFQLWVLPRTRGGAPQYAQQSFDMLNTKNTLLPLVHKNALTINQDASIYFGSFDTNVSQTYTVSNKDLGLYLFVIEGEVKVGDIVLGRRDALCITDIESVDILTLKSATFLLIEVPTLQ